MHTAQELQTPAPILPNMPRRSLSLALLKRTPMQLFSYRFCQDTFSSIFEFILHFLYSHRFFILHCVWRFSFVWWLYFIIWNLWERPSSDLNFIFVLLLLYIPSGQFLNGANKKLFKCNKSVRRTCSRVNALKILLIDLFCHSVNDKKFSVETINNLFLIW